MRLKHAFAFAVLAVALNPFLHAETDTVLILHTNDIHGHIRPGYNGLGGVPYVSGYLNEVRAARSDTLVVDSGDMINKGDLLSYETNGEAMYQAMARIDYDAIAPGNHDFSLGDERLHAFMAANKLPFVCVNVPGNEGTPLFQPSSLIDVDGVKVGVLGLTVPRGGATLDMEATIRAVARESEQLDETADLIVAVCHLGSGQCAAMSPRAPHVDVFVSGHQHEVIREPKRVEETGALIICAGDYAKYVGALELTINLDTEEIVGFERNLVPMRHDETPCDDDLLKWVRAREQAVSPEAGRVVGCCAAGLDRSQSARFCAEALRQAADADIGILETHRILNAIHEGPLDVNALFMVYRPGKEPIIGVDLNGREILKYIEGDKEGRRRPLWAGFTAGVAYGKPLGQRVAESSLDPERSYRVALTQGEWEGAVKPSLSEARAKEVAAEIQPVVRVDEATGARSNMTILDALTAYADSVTARGISIDAAAEELTQACAP